MGLIRKPAELEIQPQIKMLIYGQSGIGKSTIALSAPKPLLFDFDGGINRVNYSLIKDTVQIKSYENLLEVITKEDLSEYDTFVIDTGSKCLDYMDAYIIARNPRLGKANGALTLQGYGERKMEFKQLLKLISSKGKHVIFIAQRTQVPNCDEEKYEPLFGGSSLADLMQDLDLMGYMEANGRKRTITFDSTSKSEGKNTCNLPSVMEVPVIIDDKGNVTGNNDFILESVIAPYISNLKKRVEEGKKYNAVIAEIKEQIELITDAKSANDFISRIDAFSHVGSSKAMAAKMLQNKAASLNFTFDSKTKKYVGKV